MSSKNTTTITRGQVYNQKEQRKDRATNHFTLSQYFEAFWHHKAAALVMTTCFSLTAICFGAVLPAILAHAIDLVSQHQKLQWGSELITTLLFALCTVIAATISNAIGLQGFVRVDSPAQNYIRSKILDRLMHESAAFYATTMTGSLTSNVTAYINGYATVQQIIFMQGINLVLPLVVGIGIVAVQSPLLALMFVIITCGIGAKTMVDSRTRAPYRRARKDTNSRLNGFVGDVISNNATVRMFAGERHEKHGLLEHQKSWRLAAQANMGMFTSHYISLVGGINIFQVCGIGFAAWLAATNKISLGLVVFAISYSQRLSNGLLELGPLVQTYQGALMDAAPISEILISPQTIVDSSTAKRLVVQKGDIDIENISYEYEEGAQPVLDNLTLHIAAGQSIGLVGRSGGGKTTLTNLLLRSANVKTGHIKIDGEDIRKVTQQSLRKSISYIPQDSQLFHRTIRENIAYGKPNAKNKEIIAAAKKAHVWDFIQGLPEGLETKVGERGVKLSGGQRQRVAIARAILKDAPILIFDEATSALDSESEQYIQASLDELMKNRTTIVIAHRLSTIQKMDRIIVLDRGHIIEDDTHNELVKQKGLYASLWSHQTGGFIDEVEIS